MKRITISLLLALSFIGLQFIIPIPGSRSVSAGMDTINRDAAYGFPLYFKEKYSGGISGASSSTTNGINLLIDLMIIFGVTYAILSVTTMLIRKSSGHKVHLR